jgi:hypothetical protein
MESSRLLFQVALCHGIGELHHAVGHAFDLPWFEYAQ